MDIYIYIKINMHIYIHIYIHMCLFVCLFLCVSVCVRACVRACVRTCMCVYVCVAVHCIDSLLSPPRLLIRRIVIRRLHVDVVFAVIGGARSGLVGRCRPVPQRPV